MSKDCDYCAEKAKRDAEKAAYNNACQDRKAAQDKK